MTAPAGPLTGTLSRRRQLTDSAATGLVYASVLVALVPLGLLLFYVIHKGAAIVNVDFLTKDIPITTRRPGPGMGPAVVGTLLITAAATLMAVPIGVMAAVYVTEFDDRSMLSRLIRFLSDVMAGVPSIVMGLFVYTVWVLRFGQSGFAGALALSALMLPIVIRSTEAMLRLVPRDLREASAALAAGRARTVLTVVLPAALPGIVSGVLLAVARAAGETAPLLFTVGAVTSANTNVFRGTNTALSAQIFRNAQQPFVGAQDRAWGAALTLIALVLLLTVGARIVATRFTRR